MIKVNSVTASSVLNIDCNTLVFNNIGLGECYIVFNSTGTILEIEKEKTLYVYSSKTALVDNLVINFKNNYSVNSLEVIQTKI